MTDHSMALCVLFTLLLTLICVESTFIPSLSSPVVFCGEQAVYTEDNGTFISHGGFNKGRDYGKDLRCTWTIEAPEGLLVKLSSDTFVLEGDSCNYDYVELFDGRSTESRSIGRQCGDEFTTLTSTQPFLTVLFVTDRTYQRTGFNITYSFTTELIHACPEDGWTCGNGNCIIRQYMCDHDDDCGDDSDEENCDDCTDGQFQCVDGQKCIPDEWRCDGVYDCRDDSDEHTGCATDTPVTYPYTCGGASYRNSTNGTITSPNYPDLYPKGALCYYIIDVGANSTGILLTFSDDFSLEPSNGCYYDKVIVTGEESEDGQQELGPFCGKDSPGSINITGSTATVRFTSDTSEEFTGYSLDWQSID